MSSSAYESSGVDIDDEEDVALQMQTLENICTVCTCKKRKGLTIFPTENMYKICNVWGYRRFFHWCRENAATRVNLHL